MYLGEISLGVVCITGSEHEPVWVGIDAARGSLGSLKRRSRDHGLGLGASASILF